MNNSTIKPKIDYCVDCGVMAPLTAKRCFICYPRHRSNVNAEKHSKQPPKPLKHYSIPAKSEKQIDRDIKYAKQRKKYLAEHRKCGAQLPKCTHNAIQIHHKAGRIGKLLFDESKWLAICWECHNWITEHSKEAIEMGLSEKRNT